MYFQVRGLKFAVVVSAAFALVGCVIPGSNFSDSGMNTVDTGDADVSSQVNVYPLSPSLVATLKQEQFSPSAEANPELDQQIAAYDYRIGVADVLNVTIWDHPELTIPAGSFRSAADSGNWVHSDGTIFYPYIGKVHVAGKTVPEVRDQIAEALSQFIEAPQVDVSISAFRSQRVHVTGEVAAPLALPVTNVPLTLLDAVNLTGGLTPLADWHNVVLTRDDHEHRVSLQALMQHGDLSNNYLLQDGDIVHVSRNDDAKVYLLGEINSPSVVTIGRNKMSLTEAIASGEGLNNAVADATGVFVIRATKSGERLADIYQLDMSNASALMLASNFQMQPGDVVYVSTKPIAMWNRLIVQLIPTAQSLFYLTSAANDLEGL